MRPLLQCAPAASNKNAMLSRKSIKKLKPIASELLVTLLYVASVALALIWLTRNHTAIALVFGVDDNVTLDLGSITSVLSIASAALAIVISNRQESIKSLESTRDQTYQNLEIESINLFRFEIENVELARLIWDDSKSYADVQADPNASYQVLQHLCQILNLFEMAVRHKEKGNAHEDVFASWEAWIYDLCSSKMFLHYWYLDDLKSNYIPLFQEIIDSGIKLAHGDAAVNAVLSEADRINDANFLAFKSSVKAIL